MMAKTTILRGIAAMLMAGACTLAPAGAVSPREAPASVTIDWTAHGIPHVRAQSFRGLGYGYGYAATSLDACGILDMVVTYSGERARFAGRGTDVIRMLGRRPIANDVEDLSRRLLVDDAHVATMRSRLPRDVRDLVDGYAAGINRYVADTGADRLPVACRGANRVPEVTGDDILRRAAGMAMLLGSGLFLQDLYDAAPPSGPGVDTTPAAQVIPPEHLLAGSNAFAFGKARTGGGGVLLGNPHFFWDGPDRFIEAHLTIPGRYDAMGASLLGMPLINIGFNQSLAWTHTVSTDKRGILYVLALDPTDPTHYLVDGQSVAMTRRHVSVEVRRPDGHIERESHDFWMSRYGPIVSNPAMPWTVMRAFALSDANLGNGDLLRAWLAIGESRDVASLEHVLKGMPALPWVNTIATDSRGKVFYADASVSPDLARADLVRCATGLALPFDHYVASLDGSRADCAKDGVQQAGRPRMLPVAARPMMVRDDYVENSNGSYWLTNPHAPLEGFSSVIGPERTVLNFRTRQALLQMEGPRRPAGPVTPDGVEQMLHDDRSTQADLVIDALVAACRRTPTVAIGTGETIGLEAACAALAHWDRRFDVSSTGAHLFAAFVGRAKRPGTEDLADNPALWRTPFDAAHPLDTPRDFDADNPAVLRALGEAAKALIDAAIPLDASLGQVQFATRNETHWPLSGGATFSAISGTLRKGVGFTDPFNPSNSYIQVVSFERSGPRVDAVLASSQSGDPTSPFFADQTRLYSEKRWTRLPFARGAVRRARVGNEVVLALPAGR